MRPLSGVTSLLATGGGARSDLWLGLVSGALDLPVHRPGREPGAADGAAILAMPAAGLHADLAGALRTLRPRPGATVPPLATGRARAQHREAFGRLYGEARPASPAREDPARA